MTRRTLSIFATLLAVAVPASALAAWSGAPANPPGSNANGPVWSQSTVSAAQAGDAAFTSGRAIQAYSAGTGVLNMGNWFSQSAPSGGFDLNVYGHINMFPANASTTPPILTLNGLSKLNVYQICLTGDICRTSWPVGGGGGSGMTTSSADGRYVAKAGDTMTGVLNVGTPSTYVGPNAISAYGTGVAVDAYGNSIGVRSASAGDGMYSTGGTSGSGIHALGGTFGGFFQASAANGTGVRSTGNGTGYGVNASTDSGVGVYGSTGTGGRGGQFIAGGGSGSGGVGVYANGDLRGGWFESNNTGVLAAGTGNAIEAHATNGYGLYSQSDNGTGVVGLAYTVGAFGGIFYNQAAGAGARALVGVSNNGTSGSGVEGDSTGSGGVGVRGVGGTYGTLASGLTGVRGDGSSAFGIEGYGPVAGVYGKGSGGSGTVGVFGDNTTAGGIGVEGRTSVDNSNTYGVYGLATGVNARGGYFQATGAGGAGVESFGGTGSGTAVVGHGNFTAGMGGFFEGYNGIQVLGNGTAVQASINGGGLANGVAGSFTSAQSQGVGVQAAGTLYGVQATAMGANGIGVYGIANGSTGYGVQGAVPNGSIGSGVLGTAGTGGGSGGNFLSSQGYGLQARGSASLPSVYADHPTAGPVFEAGGGGATYSFLGLNGVLRQTGGGTQDVYVGNVGCGSAWSGMAITTGAVGTAALPTLNCTQPAIVSNGTNLSLNAATGDSIDLTINNSLLYRFNSTNALKAGGGSWGSLSDARLKNIKGSFTRGLDDIEKINTVYYTYNGKTPLIASDHATHVGVIAQNVLDVIPEAVTKGDDGYYIVNNDPIIWTMLNSIKELKTDNDLLKSQNDSLKSQLDDLTKRVEKLEAAK